MPAMFKVVVSAILALLLVCAAWVYGSAVGRVDSDDLHKGVVYAAGEFDALPKTPVSETPSPQVAALPATQKKADGAPAVANKEREIAALRVQLAAELHHSEYQSYDLQALTTLSDQNDVMAKRVLALRLQTQDPNVQLINGKVDGRWRRTPDAQLDSRIEQLYVEAFKLGYPFAIDDIARFKESFLRSKELTDDQRVDFHAWNVVDCQHYNGVMAGKDVRQCESAGLLKVPGRTIPEADRVAVRSRVTEIRRRLGLE